MRGIGRFHALCVISYFTSLPSWSWSWFRKRSWYSLTLSIWPLDWSYFWRRYSFFSFATWTIDICFLGYLVFICCCKRANCCIAVALDLVDSVERFPPFFGNNQSSVIAVWDPICSFECWIAAKFPSSYAWGNKIYTLCFMNWGGFPSIWNFGYVLASHRLFIF